MVPSTVSINFGKYKHFPTDLKKPHYLSWWKLDLAPVFFCLWEYFLLMDLNWMRNLHLHVACHFDVRNAVVLLRVLSTSHDADISAVESHDTNTSASDTWFQCWCQWYHMPKSYVAPYFIVLTLMNAVVPFCCYRHHMMLTAVAMLHPPYFDNVD